MCSRSKSRSGCCSMLPGLRYCEATMSNRHTLPLPGVRDAIALVQTHHVTHMACTIRLHADNISLTITIDIPYSHVLWDGPPCEVWPTPQPRPKMRRHPNIEQSLWDSQAAHAMTSWTARHVTPRHADVRLERRGRAGTSTLGQIDYRPTSLRTTSMSDPGSRCPCRLGHISFGPTACL
jgi:hypothetical protein